MSNSFGFGGTNCSLVFGAGPLVKLSQAYIDGVGVIGPGSTDWDAARDMLTGPAAYRYQPTVLPAPSRCCRRPSGAAAARSSSWRWRSA